MKFFCRIPFILLLNFAANCNADSDRIITYHGLSDVSAAVAIDQKTFIVAGDETNTLTLYEFARTAKPIDTFDLTEFLDINPKNPEADIEAATRIGNRIYWITSHGRSKNGKLRPNRYRFFATTIKNENAKATIHPTGSACKTLLQTLLDHPNMQNLGLQHATRLGKKKQKNLAPKKQGLNIEAICASADGSSLYIGFRNPRPADNALVIKLTNPAQVIDKAATPEFAQPILWNLAGLGIRSMEYSPYHKAYLIIAGPHDQTANFRLYRWSGSPTEQPKPVPNIDLNKLGLTPEAMITFKNSPRIFILSDDGPNKFLRDSGKKYFRTIWLRL